MGRLISLIAVIISQYIHTSKHQVIHLEYINILFVNYTSTKLASACNVGYPGLIPGLGRAPGEGNGNPLQYSCLENPMDRGAWEATVHGVAKSRTQLSDFTFTKLGEKLKCSQYMML